MAQRLPTIQLQIKLISLTQPHRVGRAQAVKETLRVMQPRQRMRLHLMELWLLERGIQQLLQIPLLGVIRPRAQQMERVIRILLRATQLPRILQAKMEHHSRSNAQHIPTSSLPLTSPLYVSNIIHYSTPSTVQLRITMANLSMSQRKRFLKEILAYFQSLLEIWSEVCSLKAKVEIVSSGDRVISSLIRQSIELMM
jgi:hypothetical protein